MQVTESYLNLSKSSSSHDSERVDLEICQSLVVVNASDRVVLEISQRLVVVMQVTVVLKICQNIVGVKQVTKSYKNLSV